MGAEGLGSSAQGGVCAAGKGLRVPQISPSCLSWPTNLRNCSHHAGAKQLFCAVRLSQLRNE